MRHSQCTLLPSTRPGTRFTDGAGGLGVLFWWTEIFLLPWDRTGVLWVIKSKISPAYHHGTHTCTHTLTHLEAGTVSMCSNNSEPIARSVLTTNSKRYDSGEVIGEEILYNRGGREMINLQCTMHKTCSTDVSFHPCSIYWTVLVEIKIFPCTSQCSKSSQ